MALNVKKTFLFAGLFSLFAALSGGQLQAQDITGKWKTTDEKTGKEKSIVEIYETDGEYFGKIVSLLEDSAADDVCDQCTGKKRNQPLLGMVIIEGLKKDGSGYKGGSILDPENGTVYNCFLELENPQTLKVRGYKNILLLGRTQLWQREN